MTTRLLLLDSASIYFRAFHAVPLSLTGPDGAPNGAIRGFLDLTARLLADHPAGRLVACFDADWRPAFRVAALPAYKAHRVAPDGGEAVPAELVPQVPVIEAVLDAAGFARLGLPGFEADDVIGTLAAREDGPVDIATGDRDLYQLVRDDRPVRVLSLGKGGPRVVDETTITARYGIPGRAYADFATLRGDPSDGLPGVPGIGEKTAAALIARFGSLPALRAAAADRQRSDDGFPAGSRRRLLAADDYLDRADVVVRVATDAPAPELADTLTPRPHDPAALLALSNRHGLAGPLGRVGATLGWDLASLGWDVAGPGGDVAG